MIRKIKTPILRDRGIDLVGQVVLVDSENKLTFAKDFLSHLIIKEEDSNFFVYSNNKKLVKISFVPTGQNLGGYDLCKIDSIEEINKEEKL
ncbi:hypothetical protein [Alphaproteobacteria bacterium endosymbiont of Tiliacea citrago]|uniref:hypothetical protein n=1 Tax=Alphaproteobacteria bacterium endosymbiont of Tiliacea citrago TaxID=3077944 RepID=UPI00313AE8FA